MHYSTSIVAALVSMGYFALPAYASPKPNPVAAAVDAYVTDAPLVTGRKPVTEIDTAAGTLGAANVHNYCDFTVYLSVCGQGEDNGEVIPCSAIHTLAAGTGTYSETYSSPNNGISIKMNPNKGEVNKPILQLDYTNTGSGQVSYDISETTGDPWRSKGGFTLTTSNIACLDTWCLITDPTNGTPHDCPIGDNIDLSLCKDTYTP